jgi:hypothetical protein
LDDIFVLYNSKSTFISKRGFLSENPFFFGNECQFHVQLGSKTLERV